MKELLVDLINLCFFLDNHIAGKYYLQLEDNDVLTKKVIQLLASLMRILNVQLHYSFIVIFDMRINSIKIGSG